ncbi:hypothetical protein [Aquifex sp.]
MNFAPLIFEEARKEGRAVEFLLVAGAPLILRRIGRIVKLTERPLTPNDIRETLMTLREHAPVKQKLDPFRGYFSFGIQNVGRFRVVYYHQRGTLTLSVLKTTINPAPLEQLLENASEVLEKSFKILHSRRLICVVSPSYNFYSEVMGSLLQEYGNRRGEVIYTLERPIMFLLKHARGVFIQREVGIDVENLDTGLMEGVSTFSNLIYINDMFVSNEEMIQLLAKYYPMPSATVFPQIGEGLRGLGYLKEKLPVDSFWFLRPTGEKVLLEIEES